MHATGFRGVTLSASLSPVPAREHRTPSSEHPTPGTSAPVCPRARHAPPCPAPSPPHRIAEVIHPTTVFHSACYARDVTTLFRLLSRVPDIY